MVGSSWFMLLDGVDVLVFVGKMLEKLIVESCFGVGMLIVDVELLVVDVKR